MASCLPHLERTHVATDCPMAGCLKSATSAPPLEQHWLLPLGRLNLTQPSAKSVSSRHKLTGPSVCIISHSYIYIYIKICIIHPHTCLPFLDKASARRGAG